MNTETEFFRSALQLIKSRCPEVGEQIEEELYAQRRTLKLIASENYNSIPVLAAASALTMDKYSEGYLEEQPDGSFVPKRYYAGCERTDKIEELAVKYAKELFGAEFAYVQPHSGSDANLIAYYAIVKWLRKFKPDCYDKDNRPILLSMDINAGGHLTHSNPANIVNELFEVHTYGVNDEGFIDYDVLKQQVLDEEPEVILAGYSAYPRKLDFSKFREIANEVGAILMCDMAHFSGLVAGKVFTGVYDPVPYCDIVTSTTQKTLRAGRGGLILAKNEFAPYISKGMPMVQGGPLNNMIAAKAVGFSEALKPDFQYYADQVVRNCKELADALVYYGVKLLTGGTDNHLLIIDLTPYKITGRQAEQALLECGIVVNRNSIPNDPNGYWYTSGLRLGTAALTSRGMRGEEMREIAKLIASVLSDIKPVEGSKSQYEFKEPNTPKGIQIGVAKLLDEFPLYPELEI